MVDGRCVRHGFEESTASCRTCGFDFCDECLVYAFGPNKPPLCVNCALAKSGVRSNAASRQVASRRELRKLEKQAAKAKSGRRFGRSRSEDAEPATPEPVVNVDAAPADAGFPDAATFDSADQRVSF